MFGKDQGSGWFPDRLLGGVYAGMGQLAEAIKHFEHALRLKPDYPEAYDNLRKARELLQQQGGPAQP